MVWPVSRKPPPDPCLTYIFLGRILMNQADVLAKVTALKTSVDQLVAIQGAGPDLTPIGNAVDAVKAEVDVAITAAQPTGT